MIVEGGRLFQQGFSPCLEQEDSESLAIILALLLQSIVQSLFFLTYGALNGDH